MRLKMDDFCNRHTKTLLAFILFLLNSQISFALPEDRQQVVELQADSADLNQLTHRGIYEGNVQLTQGSTHLQAATASTEGTTKNKLKLAIANGNKEAQAHFWTLTAADKPPFHAYADHIYYYPNKHLIELIGNAHVAQGDNSFSAPVIRYDSQNEHVSTVKVSDARTTIIIHPEKTHD